MIQRRYAYCIGANGPQPGGLNSLKYAEKDAQRVADALKAVPCAFTKTEWVAAVDRNSTLAGLRRFIEQCSSADLLMIHFSGHAIYDGDLYLLCNDTDADDLVTSAIEIEAIKKMLSRCKVHSKVLILDCCHAGGAHTGAFKGEQEVKDALNTALQGSANVILSACSRRERTRELDTLDGGAGFLSWALVSSCTTHFQEVSLDGLSLSLADVLRWIPMILQKINGSLNEKERLPIPMALIEVQGGEGEIWLTAPREHISQRSERNERLDMMHRLKAMLADHSGFMRDRLESFVGRQEELEEIQQRIAEKLHTGGYLTITGQAGQGKSSIIAKLVVEYGPENVAFHFIPFNPGPDHQIGLLRNLMARLILKYQLPDIYVASESRPALRDYFPKVLSEVVARGAKEVIFVDGLDQLEEDFNGVRDLSFLPINPPPGIVFVLGTRPNDTLRPLELLKPHAEYKLPNLRRHDFDLILEHRHVQLKRDLADQFYQAMQENALYLDLVARELKEKGPLSPVNIIKRIANNPENLFSLSMDRLRRKRSEWREVIKPILGVLLAAREPLAKQHIRQILAIDADQLNETMQRLGGLIADSGQQRYTLFHLKLRDYLRQDESNPTKEYIFASDEEEGWHKTLGKWCEQSDLATIWQDVNNDPIEQSRREYARQHYIAHLYYAHEWQQLFQILDAQQFGLAKVRQDPSMRSYSLDLDFGRQAIAWQGWELEERVKLLPRLWHYTWLKCSLGSRADEYPLEAFRILLLLGREREAQSLAEMLTEPLYKARVLLEIAKLIGQQGRKQDSIQMLLRATEVAQAVIESTDRSKLAAEQVKVLVLGQEWEWAEAIILSMERSDLRAQGLCELGRSLALAQQWEQAEKVWEEAEKVISLIEESSPRLKALRELLKSFASVKQWDKATAMTRITRSSDERIEVLIELGKAFVLAQQSEKAEMVWKEVEEALPRIEPDEARISELCALSEALAQAGQSKRAQAIWARAQKMADRIDDAYGKVKTQRKLGMTQIKMLVETQQWEKAEALIQVESGSWQRMFMLYELGKALTRAQRWEQAENVTRMIEWDIRRRQALLELAESLAEAQQRQHAEKKWFEVESALHTIEQDASKAEILCKLAKALAQTQQWDQAEVVVDTIHDSRQRTRALGELGKALALAQQWERTQTIANKIKKSKVRIEVLRELGKALALAQQRLRAKLVWDEIAQEIDNIVGDREKAGMWCDFAKDLVQAQQWKLAETIIHRIPPDSRLEPPDSQRLELRHGVTPSASIPKVEAFRELAEALARAQQRERAEAIWTEVETMIRLMKDSDRKARELGFLAEALARAQQRERAEAVWAEAESMVYKMEIPFWRSEAFRELVVALVRAQRWEQAEKVIPMINDGGLRTRTIGELGKALIAAKQWERAEDIASSIELSYQKVEMLLELAEALTRAQLRERAEPAWEVAEFVAHAIKSSYQKAEALRVLAEALARTQQRERAEATWTEAESVARSVQDRPLRISALRALAEALARAQQWDRAERIVHSIEIDDEKISALERLAEVLLASKDYVRLLNLVQFSWLQVETTKYAVQLLPLAFGFIPLKPEIGMLFHEVFKKVDTFFKDESL